MDNAESIRLVKGVVSDKSPMEALRYVRIYKRNDKTRIQGSGAQATVDAPFEVDADVAIVGARFFAAMNACNDPDIRVTDKNMIIKQGPFRAALPLMDTTKFPLMQPDGDLFIVTENLTDKFAMLRPFIGTQRSWMKGVTIRGGSLYATNGLAMIRIDTELDAAIDVSVPEATVIELARIALPITALRVSDHSCTFKLGEYSWLRSQVLAEPTPDLSKLMQGVAQTAVPEGLREAVETVAPFCEVETIDTGAYGVAAVGTTEARIDGFPLEEARFRVDVLTAILNIATHLDIKQRPEHSVFSGDGFTGVAVGVSR